MGVRPRESRVGTPGGLKGIFGGKYSLEVEHHKLNSFTYRIANNSFTFTHTCIPIFHSRGLSGPPTKGMVD